MEDFFRHDNVCPFCGHKLSGAASVLDKNVVPKTGDYTVCIECVEVSFFNKDMRLEKLDLYGISLEEARDINKTQFLIQQAKRKHANESRR